MRKQIYQIMKKAPIKMLFYGFRPSFLQTKEYELFASEGNFDAVIATTFNKALHEIAKAKLIGHSPIKGMVWNNQTNIDRCKEVFEFLKFYYKKPPLICGYPKNESEAIRTPFPPGG